MGVPKFFRWVAERYPTVITPFKDSPPPVDNLYLDMNGIIHHCTHPNDIDASRRSPTEKEMVQGIFGYLEKLFQAIQPKKYFLMAVDGVAPRAKMNQQRQRRYRSGYEMMVAREEALQRGEEIPEEGDVFDSNCITPGTDFMVRLSEHFKYFIAMKLQTDTAWQNCQVIFSGHDHPGEGEHKIIDFIRRRKMQPGYHPNETHCMYGLDADLIMLALATHEPHFVLLREVVTFGTPNQSRKERERREEDEAKGIKEDPTYQKPDEFVLLHVNIFREFLNVDVRSRLKTLPANYDFERVVDDFVFMCFFVGNDFLPSLPTIGINDGGMMQMLELYCDHILSTGSYFIRDCQINWNSVEMFLTQVGELELDALRSKQDEEAEFQKRQSRRDQDHHAKTTLTSTPITNMIDYKTKFYTEKHKFQSGYDPRGPEMADLRQHYIEGLSWVQQYYYQGPASWKWFYPHHYPPLASDLVNLSSIAGRLRFDKGQPFLPHQQLLAVLPPMSYRSIPKAYWPLLKSKSSPLAKFYPDHIEIDKEGAHNPWEGIVVIPFIDEKVLLLAYESVQSFTTEEDKLNNRLGLPVMSRYNKSIDPYTIPSSMFRPLTNVQVQRTIYEFPPSPAFIPKLCGGVRLGDEEIEGFGSLASKLKFATPTFEIGAVAIFGMPTRRESLLLAIDETNGMTNAEDAFSLIGQEILVGYPHYKRSRVTSVSDRRKILTAAFDTAGAFSGVNTKDLSGEEMHAFKKECENHMQFAKSKLGILLPEINVLVYVQRFVGMRLTRKGRIVRQFAKTETCYPAQLTCRLDRINILEDARYAERDRAENENDIGAKLIYIGPEPKNNPADMPIFGSVGFATEQTKKDDEFYTIIVNVYEQRQSIPQSLIDYATTNNWLSLSQLAERCRVSPLALTMVCSSLMTSAAYGSQEIGLCVKFTGKGLARVGYAKLVQSSMNPWYMGAPNIFSRMEDEGQPLGSVPQANEGGNGGGGRGGGGKGDFLGQRSSNNSVKGTWYFSQEATGLITAYIQRFEPLIRRLEAGGANSSQLDPAQFLTGKWSQSSPEDVIQEIVQFLNGSGIMDVPMINATEDSFTRGQLKELENHLTKTTPRKTCEFMMRNVVSRNLYFPVVTTSTNFVVNIPLPRDQRYQIGSRVVHCRTTGAVPFGACGTIVRMLASGQEAEVVYDEAFTEGSQFGGRLESNRGSITKLAALLVTSQLGSSNFDQREDGGMTFAGKLSNAIALERPATTPTTNLGGPARSAAPQTPASSAPSIVATGAFSIPKPKSRKVEELIVTPGQTPTTTTGGSVSFSREGSVDLAALAQVIGTNSNKEQQQQQGQGNSSMTFSGGSSGIRMADVIKASRVSPPSAIARVASTSPTSNAAASFPAAATSVDGKPRPVEPSARPVPPPRSSTSGKVQNSPPPGIDSSPLPSPSPVAVQQQGPTPPPYTSLLPAGAVIGPNDVGAAFSLLMKRFLQEKLNN